MKVSMICRRWAKAIWSCIIVFLGYKYSTNPIPEGPYCYIPDEEKNSSKLEGDWTYYTKPCKYYMCLDRRYNTCKFLGVITDDMCFDDQCKICGEKKGYLDKDYSDIDI
jgi:hypothetical protein